MALKLILQLAAALWVLQIAFPAQAQSQQIDRLLPGSTLRVSETMVSSNKTVTMGFFSPQDGPGGRDPRYLGIWYSNRSYEFVALWIANRDHPVSNGTLHFSDQGALQLLDSSGGIAWSSGEFRSAAQAVLLDSANLILTSNNNSNAAIDDQTNNTTYILWQSFDHPADVWVPTMKMYLGASNLTSWRSISSPSSGRFIMRMLPTNEFVTAPIGSPESYFWTSGAWDGRIFSKVPQMTSGYIYTFTFNDSDPNRRFFTWFEKTEYHSVFRLDHDGVIRVKWADANGNWVTVWTVPSSKCDVTELCGNNSVCSGGQIPCGCTAGSTPVNTSAWDDQDWSGGCTSTAGSSRSGSSGKNVAIGAGAAAGAAAVLLVLGITAAFIVRRKRIANLEEKKSRSGSLDVFFLGGELTPFTYKQLQAATDGFKQQLGSGGFGDVFKGTIQGEPVAVKRLKRFDDKQFRAEVSTIGTVQHINLVRLRGFCVEGPLQRLLVYEFVENGSLDRKLFQNQQHQLLDWSTRFAIAVGTAKGIAYLHEECRDRIIHCDIKPENILLDAEMRPKVADFGLAKLMGREFSRVVTSMRGTRGYLAPEWLSNLPITPKADVYSYGMTLLEIISGRRNIDARHDRLFFPLWASQQIVKSNFSALPDPRLDGQFDEDELRRAATTAIWCVQDDENQRPSMKMVVQMLNGTAHLPQPPVPDSFEFWADNDERGGSHTS